MHYYGIVHRRFWCVCSSGMKRVLGVDTAIRGVDIAILGVHISSFDVDIGVGE